MAERALAHLQRAHELLQNEHQGLRFGERRADKHTSRRGVNAQLHFGAVKRKLEELADVPEEPLGDLGSRKGGLFAIQQIAIFHYVLKDFHPVHDWDHKIYEWKSNLRKYISTNTNYRLDEPKAHYKDIVWDRLRTKAKEQTNHITCVISGTEQATDAIEQDEKMLNHLKSSIKSLAHDLGSSVDCVEIQFRDD